MTVGAISNTALLDPSQTVGASSWQTRMQQALGPVAQLFGESAQQLMSDLQSGKTSLSALAQSKGISQTDLINAIKQGLQQSSANGGPQLSDSQLTNLANTIANRVHGGHHHGGGGMSGVGGAHHHDRYVRSRQRLRRRQRRQRRNGRNIRHLDQHHCAANRCPTPHVRPSDHAAIERLDRHNVEHCLGRCREHLVDHVEHQPPQSTHPVQPDPLNRSRRGSAYCPIARRRGEWG